MYPNRLKLSPVQCELLQVVEITSDILQRRVRHPRTPRDVERTQLSQILGYQLYSIVGDLRAAGEGKNGEIGQSVH